MRVLRMGAAETIKLRKLSTLEFVDKERNRKSNETAMKLAGSSISDGLKKTTLISTSMILFVFKQQQNENQQSKEPFCHLPKQFFPIATAFSFICAAESKNNLEQFCFLFNQTHSH